MMSTIDYTKTGKLIQEARKDKGLTQLQLAEALGVTDRAVSKWERGKSFPDVGILQELADMLDLTVSELLEGERNLGSERVPEADGATLIKGVRLYIEDRKKKEILRLILVIAVIFLIILGAFAIKKANSPIDFQNEEIEIGEVRILQEDFTEKIPHLYGLPWHDAQIRIRDVLKAIHNIEIDPESSHMYEGSISLGEACEIMPYGYFDARSQKAYVYPGSYAVYEKVEDIIFNLIADQEYAEPTDYEKTVNGNRTFILVNFMYEVGHEIIAEDLKEMLKEPAPSDHSDAYTESLTVHSINQLFRDEYTSMEVYEELKKEIEYQELYDYRVYDVVFETKYTEQKKVLGPQYPEGTRRQLYLLGKSFVDEEFSICKKIDMGFAEDESE